MADGIIGTTGQTVEVTDENGNPKTMNVPEEIHTYAGWKERGYVVRRGQHSIAKFKIWKYRQRQKKDGDKTKTDEDSTDEREETGKRMFLTAANFFAESQVEPIENTEQ